MPTKRLQALLQQLQEEIAQLDETSLDEKQRLEQLVSDIELTLAQETSEQHATMLDSLRAKLIETESDHPTASGVARRLMQTLGDMGI
jgi:hypothetical protein